MVFLTHEQALHDRVCRHLLGGNARSSAAVDTGRETGIGKIWTGPLDSRGIATELRDIREEKGWTPTQKRLAHALVIAIVDRMKQGLNHRWRSK